MEEKREFPDKCRKKSASLVHHFLCCMMPVVTSSSNCPQPEPVGVGVDNLLKSLDLMDNRDDSRDLDLNFLTDLLHNNEFQSLLKVHEKVTTPEAQESKPLMESANDLAEEVCDAVSCWHQEEATELVELLQDPHLSALLSAHDQVAVKSFIPHLPEIAHEVDEDDEASVKIVRLVKGTTEPLGATIQRNEQTGIIKVARVMHGGAADRSGLIHVGDEVHEVNGVPVKGKTPDEVVQLLMGAIGPVMLKLVPGTIDPDMGPDGKMRVRAYFSYIPGEDKTMPCPEAGLAFTRGDILHIVSQDDALWWQARREGDNCIRAGLIPSRQLQEKKILTLRGRTNVSPLLSRDSNKDNKDNKDSKVHKAKFSPKMGKKTKKNKKLQQQQPPEVNESETEEIFTYDEVERFYPKSGIYRPVVLVGHGGVGCNELKRRLIATDPEHFKTPIPHTTRDQKPGEVNGEEYVFITRPDMEREIQEKKFVEYGEYRNNLYGTSLAQVCDVINSGHVAVLCPHPQALHTLRLPDIRPYVVFVKPPAFERLQQTRTSSQVTHDGIGSRNFSDDDFRQMISTAQRMEAQYGHYFDQIIVNDELQKAVNELCLVAHRLETEPQWVPASWVR